ncbi:MAG: argininosuccinate lyase, partial [Thermoproteus sp.]|nr:argininosuccinate lyase [Thermoproteus sp.]
IRLRLLAHLSSLEVSVDGLRCVLAKRALEYAECVMPSFTHFQPAQPITFGHYLMAMEELLEDFKSLSPSVKSVVDKSPLGSGPAGGTAAPLDRPRLAQLAGFSSAAVNTLYASSSRFFASAAASLVVALLVELSRFVDDLVAWSSPMIGYLRPPDDHVSTSSIMPHKRNPVTLEVFRARISEAVADLVALLGIQEKIGYGYSLDLQEATRHLWRIFKIADEGLSILADFLAKAAFDCGRAGADAERYPVTSSDAAERMALGGTPFRAAYFKIAEAIKRGEFKPPPPGDAVRRPVLGSPHPNEVRRMAKRILESCGSSPQA